MEFDEKEKIAYAISTAFRIKDGWKPLFIVPVGAGFLYLLKGADAMMQELQLLFIYTVMPVSIWYLSLFAWHYFTAPFALKIIRLLKGRELTHKITDADLQRMLNGFIYEDTFHYRADKIFYIELFDGHDNFEKLKARYNLLKINCPANCRAFLNITLVNTMLFYHKPLSFWVKDGLGNEHEFDYNDTLDIIGFEVGQNSQIYIKLEYPDDVEIDECTSLRISLDSWKYDL